MDDIRRRDRELWRTEALRLRRVTLSIVIITFAFISFPRFGEVLVPFCIAIGVLIGHALIALRASKEKRFSSLRLHTLWNTCEDRVARFDEAVRKMKKSEMMGFVEMPQTIHSVFKALYVALRRADLIADEVSRSEGLVTPANSIVVSQATDAQANALYQMADRNLSEYRGIYAGLLGGVQRTEAQAAVFITTLDNLRVKLLGYRLASRSPGLDTAEFVSALGEAKIQLQAIDKALDELDLRSLPKVVITDHHDLRTSIVQPSEQEVEHE